MEEQRHRLPPSVSLRDVRRIERKLFTSTARFVLGNLFKAPVRSTRHFREWFRIPMNYARMMELPLTILFMNADRKDRILDVSSPKLLSLFLAREGHTGVVAADLEDYFVADFEAYQRHAGVQLQTSVFDAGREIPFADGHFDKIFSVSVLEHIPHDGDIRALREMLRVLKPGGTLVITLPAFAHYVEEWAVDAHYWKSIQNEKGETFFQRRYDEDRLRATLAVPGGVVQEVLLVAEKPIRPPRIGKEGIMLHNSYLINKVPLARLIKLFRRLPFVHFLAEHLVSRRCHYLTSDWQDPNIRQVAVKMTKTIAT